MSADSSSSGMPPERQSNGIGLAGFIVSIVGLVLTCGVLCPIGLILSLVGLRKQPKGFAIAGTVIGALGSVFFALVGATLVAGYVGLKKVAAETGGDVQTTASMFNAVNLINMQRTQKGALPDAATGNGIIAICKDSAGRALRYDPSGDSFVIRGVGPDGVFDTPDDAKMDSTVTIKVK